MEFISVIMAFLGTVGIMGLFLFVMIKKYEWKLAQVIAGLIMGILVAANFPDLATAVNDGMTGIVGSVK